MKETEIDAIGHYYQKIVKRLFSDTCQLENKLISNSMKNELINQRSFFSIPVWVNCVCFALKIDQIDELLLDESMVSVHERRWHMRIFKSFEKHSARWKRSLFVEEEGEVSWKFDIPNGWSTETNRTEKLFNRHRTKFDRRWKKSTRFKRKKTCRRYRFSSRAFVTGRNFFGKRFEEKENRSWRMRRNSNRQNRSGFLAELFCSFSFVFLSEKNFFQRWLNRPTEDKIVVERKFFQRNDRQQTEKKSRRSCPRSFNGIW